MEVGACPSRRLLMWQPRLSIPIHKMGARRLVPNRLRLRPVADREMRIRHQEGFRLPAGLFKSPKLREACRQRRAGRRWKRLSAIRRTAPSSSATTSTAVARPSTRPRPKSASKDCERADALYRLGRTESCLKCYEETNDCYEETDDEVAAVLCDPGRPHVAYYGDAGQRGRHVGGAFITLNQKMLERVGTTQFVVTRVTQLKAKMCRGKYCA